MRGVQTTQTMNEELQSLELSFLDTNFRHSRNDIEPLIADDFLEFGSSGRSFDKAAVIDFLVNEPDTIAQRTMSRFQAKELAPGVVLVTFRIDQVRRDGTAAPSSLRSSLWRRNDDRWQLVFHQGTPVA